MKIKYNFYTLLCLFSMLPLTVHAQNAGEKVVEFFSDNATMEDNPKQHTYNITIFSPDGEWKMQLNYKSESMFGTFTNDDFDLKGSGKNYNYARNPNNSMVFYSFTDMKVSVTDEGTLYRVKANCLANNNTRFIAEATIDAPQPESVIKADLGYARVENNSFYGTWSIYAENDDYKLGYGIASNELMGTFYRADLLMPELWLKKEGKMVNVLTATAVHTEEGDTKHFQIDILGDDLVQYSLTMFNGPYEVEIIGRQDIEVGDMILQDLTEMYGCLQFGAMSDDYAVAVALTPEAFNSGRTKWTRDDVVMQYTRVLDIAEGTSVEIFDINIELDLLEGLSILKVDVIGMDGILYHITMFAEKETMPEPKDTVNIDFGHVSMIDYTQGLGMVGLGAVMPGKYQMRFYLYAPYLEGDFENEDFNIEMCDMMVVTGNTYLFHDGKYAQAKMEKVDGQTRITMDMYCIDEVLYHATMYIDPLKCLEGGQYSIDMEDGVDMVSIQTGHEANYGEYLLQFQNLDNVYDKQDNIVGDGYFFAFYFAQDGNGVSGEYGYSAGTLAEDVTHLFYENKCEVRVAPVAGTLRLEPVESLTIKFDDFHSAKTYLYKVRFQVLGQNGAIYEAEGQNVIICMTEEGELVNIDESASAILQQHLEKQGYRVRKIQKDGKIILETPGRQYDMQGRQIGRAS